MHLNLIYTFLNGISCCYLFHVDESHMNIKVMRSSSLRESKSDSRPSVRPPAYADPPVSSFHNPIKNDSAVKISCGGKKKCKGMAWVIKIYWIDHELRAVFFHPRSTGCDGCFVGRGSFLATRHRKPALTAKQRDLCPTQLQVKNCPHNSVH